MKLLFNRICHEKIQFTNFQSPYFQHFLVEIQHQILYKNAYKCNVKNQQENVENLDFQNL